MTGEIEPPEAFHCSNCESLGEITYSCLKSQHQNAPVKVLIKNLPPGITNTGIKNLFLTVRKPLTVSLYPKTHSMFVTFQSMNEAELAVRDLNCKPPYYLKVTICHLKIKNEAIVEDNVSEKWDFSQEEASVKIEKEEEKLNEKTADVINQIQNVVGNLGYDPSVRMRQRKLDFKTTAECVSLGRGYMFMGDSDRFVGGLQKFKISTEKSKPDNDLIFPCQSCGSSTSKICDKCSSSFCSKICLRKRSGDHSKNCFSHRTSEEQTPKEADLCHQNSSAHPFPQVELTSDCTVVITTYITMNTVFVIRFDKYWEKKFTWLCNEVAVEAIRGSKLKEMPEKGNLVLARYNEDLCFYRAQVSSVTGKKINIFFIDFGNTQETNLEDLKVFPESLKSEAAFAVKVNLKNVQQFSSMNSVEYFNKLTAERVPLTLKFDKENDEVVLIERDSQANVNETVNKLTMPSWKREESVYFTLGDVFFSESVKGQELEVGKTFNVIISHFDEREFLESEVFWVTNPETDNFFHTNSEMYLRIKEYCEFLKDDCYLPRINELCLAREGGEWHRCVNLKSHKTTCCLFFIDDGHSSLIDTCNIRKMILEFTEVPFQAICCTIPDEPKLKEDKELLPEIVKYLKESTGQTIESVTVLKLMGDAYCVSVPEIKKILA